jgi:CNT family concentrative nucleoside transporter
MIWQSVFGCCSCIAMAPGRRNEIVILGLRSIVSGTLTSSMIGSIVGVIGA